MNAQRRYGSADVSSLQSGKRWLVLYVVPGGLISVRHRAQRLPGDLDDADLAVYRLDYLRRSEARPNAVVVDDDIALLEVLRSASKVNVRRGGGKVEICVLASTISDGRGITRRIPQALVRKTFQIDLG